MVTPCVRSVSAKKRKETLFLFPSYVSKLHIKAKRIVKMPYPNESQEEGDILVEAEPKFGSVQDSCALAKKRLKKHEVQMSGQLETHLGRKVSPFDEAVLARVGIHNSDLYFEIMEAANVLFNEEISLPALNAAILARIGPQHSRFFYKVRDAIAGLPTSLINPTYVNEACSSDDDIDGEEDDEVDEDDELGDHHESLGINDGENSPGASTNDASPSSGPALYGKDPGSEVSLGPNEEHLQAGQSLAFQKSGTNLRPGAPSSGKSNREDANIEFFYPVYPSIEGSEVLARGNSGSFNGLGRHLDRHGHVATSGEVTVETSGCMGPTAMLGTDQHHKAAIDVTTPYSKAMAHVNAQSNGASLVNLSSDTWPVRQVADPHIADSDRTALEHSYLVNDGAINADTQSLSLLNDQLHKTQRECMGPSRVAHKVITDSTSAHSLDFSVNLGTNGPTNLGLATPLCEDKTPLGPCGPSRSDLSAGPNTGSGCHHIVNCIQRDSEVNAAPRPNYVSGLGPSLASSNMNESRAHDPSLMLIQANTQAINTCQTAMASSSSHAQAQAISALEGGSCVGSDGAFPLAANYSHSLGLSSIVGDVLTSGSGPTLHDCLCTSQGRNVVSQDPRVFANPKFDHQAQSNTPTNGQVSSGGTTCMDFSSRKKFSELFGTVHSSVNHTVSSEGAAPDSKIVAPDFPLGFVSHGTRSENLILKVPQDLTAVGSIDWVTTLVGYFIGKGLPYSLVSSTTKRYWDDFGLIDMLATDSGFFFFTFSCAEKRDAVLEGGPWYIAGQPLILQPWKPSLRLDKNDVHSIPIWVNLYGIPLELWNPKGISFIASYIGKPLRVDKMTASRRRISYARVCVEVSGDLDLIEKFAIETEDGAGHTTILDIDVEYQWKPSRCSNCSTFGHDCNRVATQRPGLDALRPHPSQPSHTTNYRNRSNTTKEGAWQVVQRKDKGKKIAEDAGLVVTPRVSPHWGEASGKASAQEKHISNRERNPYLGGCVASSSEHVICSITDVHPLCENRTANVQISNSFNGLIPYVYDREDNAPTNDCEGVSPTEDILEEDDPKENFNEVGTETAFVSPVSARQRKKEAKMAFSGSRPKGRHRS